MTNVELIVTGLVACVGVCACALFLLEWPGFLSLVEVVFCFGVLRYVHSLCCGGSLWLVGF
jgi:hypothetical protein